jgi:predicted ATPase
LLLWHNVPGADATAEAKLRRALDLAREQTALSWELRISTSLARLRQRRGRFTDGYELLFATYSRFSEGFHTSDLIRARALLEDLEANRQLGSLFD